MTNADIAMLAHEIVFLATAAKSFRDAADSAVSESARQVYQQRASSLDDDICALCGDFRREIKVG